MRIEVALLLLGGTMALAGCANGDWPRMQAEFPQVRANCGLTSVELERDREDRRLLYLIFRHRNNMQRQAIDDGRFACVEHWARERGYRLGRAGANGPTN